VVGWGGGGGRVRGVCVCVFKVREFGMEKHCRSSGRDIKRFLVYVYRRNLYLNRAICVERENPTWESKY